MPTLNIPEYTFRRLAARAAALNITVEEMVAPALDQLAKNGNLSPQMPLTGEAWKQEFDAWTKEIESRADRYPPGFRVDDSRETIYGEMLEFLSEAKANADAGRTLPAREFLQSLGQK